MIKRAIVFSGLIVVATCVSMTSVNTESTAGKGKSYGKVKVDETKAITVEEMMKKFDPSKGDQEFTVHGKLTQVCQSAGCWIKVENATDTPLMVRFKDHFTIPKSTAAGTMAYFHGIAYMDTTSVEMLKHYAQDAKKSQEEIDKITEPKVTMMFQADGIKF